MDVSATFFMCPCPCDSSLSAHVVWTNPESMFQRVCAAASIVLCVRRVSCVRRRRINSDCGWLGWRLDEGEGGGVSG